MSLDHIRNKDLLGAGTRFDKEAITPAADSQKGVMDVISLGRHTAYLERNANLLLVFFLMEGEELSYREEVHYGQLASQGWVFPVVVWGQPPDSVSAVQVFDKDGKQLKKAAGRKELRAITESWWGRANAGRPRLLAEPRRVVILSNDPPPIRNTPPAEWDFISLLGSFLGGKVHAKDIDGGCIAGGHVVIIEEKQLAELDTATKIAFEKLSYGQPFVGFGVLQPPGLQPKVLRYTEGNPSKKVDYSITKLLIGIQYTFERILEKVRKLLAVAHLREEMKIRERIEYKVKRRGQ
ncbi:MAG: hypothetical protein ABFD64_00265 [Armatimonadota bacterium]